MQTDSLGHTYYICRIPASVINGNYRIIFILSKDGYSNIDTIIIVINITHINENNELFIISSVPNHFSEFTTIKYSLPYPSHIKLSLYDIFGKEVAVLVEGWQGKTLDIQYLQNIGCLLQSGIYFCRLQAGGETKVIKMIRIE